MTYKDKASYGSSPPCSPVRSQKDLGLYNNAICKFQSSSFYDSENQCLYPYPEHVCTLQRTATHCNALQYTATLLTPNSLAMYISAFASSRLSHLLGLSAPRIPIHYVLSLRDISMLQCVAVCCRVLSGVAGWLVSRFIGFASGLGSVCRHCNTLQHAATRFNTLQHTCSANTLCANTTLTRPTATQLKNNAVT